MLIRPHTLSIITTHQCTAACDHCCFTCTPKVTKAIPVDRIHLYLDQAREIPTLQLVVFTGGECFLLGKDLDELVAHTHANGFMSRFVSNGYWAISPEKAEKRLQKLKDAGLTEANFSTGDMHAKYVPPERVRYGAVAAAEMGFCTVIMVETFADSKFDFDEFLNDRRFQNMIEQGKIIVRLSPWMPFEGEERLQYTQKYMQFLKQSSVGCSTALQVIAINPDEHLIACCGLTLEEIEEMHVGDLRQRTMAEIIRQTPDDFIKIWVHLYGPDTVIRYARQIDPTLEEPPNFAHICDSCRYMYNNDRIREAVHRFPPKNMHSIMRQYYDSLMMAPSYLNTDKFTEIFNKSYSIEEAKRLRKIAVNS